MEISETLLDISSIVKRVVIVKQKKYTIYITMRYFILLLVQEVVTAVKNAP